MPEVVTDGSSRGGGNPGGAFLRPNLTATAPRSRRHGLVSVPLWPGLKGAASDAMCAKARLHEVWKVRLMVRNPEGLLARQARVLKISIGHVPMKATGFVGGVHIPDAGEQAAE